MIAINQQISEEAASWLVDFRCGNMDAAARAEFDAWVRASPEHLRAFLEFAILWIDTSGVDPERRIDVDALVADARRSANVTMLRTCPTAARSPPAAAWRRIFTRPALGAALVASLLGLGWFMLAPSRDQSSYATPVGEQRTIALEDGSTMILNGRSRAQVHYTGVERRVHLLEGQAYFRVATNAGRHFIVQANETEVMAVGTQFDVSRSLKGTSVTVLEGSVAVYAGRPHRDGPQVAPAANAPDVEPVLMTAGKQLRIVDGEGPIPPLISIDIDTAAAWRRGSIVLESTPLPEAVEEFNRHSERLITAEDRGTRPLLLSGVFATDPEFLIRYLRARPDITIHESPSDIHIVRTEVP